ncbi:transposase [Nonomuraea sp. NPDC049141]|uniref:transposase n=1 Tax=Nonomuraea sp. NPDC049141 TaxID=3155500 RepID=UPI0033CED708
MLFPRAACRACPDRASCTGDASGKGRHLTLLPKPLQQIQTRNRAEQHTEPWKARYALRAGCEATVSETTRAHGLRNCRYKGLAKTHVQHILTAAGTNVTRLADHYTPDIIPDRPPRPISPFQQLCQRLATHNPRMTSKITNSIPKVGQSQNPRPSTRASSWPLTRFINPEMQVHASLSHRAAARPRQPRLTA